MYLAIGIVVDPDAFTWSVQVESDNPQEVAQSLFNSVPQTPEQIILIKNGVGSPDIDYHWNIGKDYQEITSVTELPAWAESELIEGAAAAIEQFSEDDLEAFAKEQQEGRPT